MTALEAGGGLVPPSPFYRLFLSWFLRSEKASAVILAFPIVISIRFLVRSSLISNLSITGFALLGDGISASRFRSGCEMARPNTQDMRRDPTNH